VPEQGKMTDELAKAAQEAARASGKAVDAVLELGRFIARYVNGPLEQGMGIFEDKLRYMRLERQVRLIDRADVFLRERGLDGPTRPVPLKIMIPLLQGACLEDDDELQDRWAALLVNAADADSGISVHRAFVSILEEIGPLEALLLEKIYAIPWDASFDGIYTGNLPEEAIPVPAYRSVDGPDRSLEQNLRPDVELALGNLVRVGCLKGRLTWGGTEFLSVVSQTVLGKAFVEACRPPSARKAL